MVNYNVTYLAEV